MGFSKTALKEWFVAILGLLTAIGVDLPVDDLAAQFDMAVEALWGVIAMIVAAVGLWLRSITSSPVVSGFKGLLGVKPK